MTSLNRLIGGISITPCEFDIIILLVKEQSRKEIAALLNKTPATIGCQMRTLYLKTHVRKNSGLVVWAAEHGFHSDGSFRPQPDPAGNPPISRARLTGKGGRRNPERRSRAAR